MVYSAEIIGIVFLLIMIYLTFLENRKNILSKFSFIFWVFVWVIGILLILFHTKVNSLLDPLNIIRVLDLYMILAFMFLFALVFYLFIKNRNNEKKIEKITRFLALKNLKNNEQINESIKTND